MDCPLHPGNPRDYAEWQPPYFKDGLFIVSCSLTNENRWALSILKGEPSNSQKNLKLTYEQLKPTLDFTAFCRHCRRPGCTIEDSRTRYEDTNRNLPVWLCPYCATEHHSYWDGMWDDYYGGLL